jgi:hypothetical protein
MHQFYQDHNSEMHDAMPIHVGDNAIQVSRTGSLGKYQPLSAGLAKVDASHHYFKRNRPSGASHKFQKEAMDPITR